MKGALSRWRFFLVARWASCKPARSRINELDDVEDSVKNRLFLANVTMPRREYRFGVESCPDVMSKRTSNDSPFRFRPESDIQRAVFRRVSASLFRTIVASGGRPL